MIILCCNIQVNVNVISLYVSTLILTVQVNYNVLSSFPPIKEQNKKEHKVGEGYFNKGKK